MRDSVIAWMCSRRNRSWPAAVVVWLGFGLGFGIWRFVRPDGRDCFGWP